MDEYFVTISIDSMTLEQVDELLGYVLTRRKSLVGVSVSYSEAVNV